MNLYSYRKMILIVVVWNFFQFRLTAQKNIELHVISADGIPFLLELDGKKINSSPEASVNVNQLDSKEFEALISFPETSTSFKGKIYTIWEGAPTNNREFTYTIEKSGNGSKRIRFLNSSPLNIKKDSIKTENKTSKDTLISISENEFNNRLYTINLLSFEESREHKAEDLFTRVNLNINQITEVCNAFDYDQSKLKFIKFVYSSSGDKKDFNKLLSVFQYKNTKVDFSKWLEVLNIK
ncbi:MAG: DUF4476 domain-containing protein [Bacteroidota bacterium]